MTTEKITTFRCPRCETPIIYIPPDHGYVVIDGVRYLTPQPVCDLLKSVNEERDALKAVFALIYDQTDRAGLDWDKLDNEIQGEWLQQMDRYCLR